MLELFGIAKNLSRRQSGPEQQHDVAANDRSEWVLEESSLREESLINSRDQNSPRGVQTTRPNFRVAVLLKYRSNAHDGVEGTYTDDPGPIGLLRKLLGGR